MGIDASIPLQTRSLNLAQMYAQAQGMKQNEQMMEMRQQEMDLREREMLDRMDARQREAAKEGVKDLHAAVRWADTPEKWAQVQAHYGQYDPQLAQVPFDQRETALIKLGQMGQYLEDTAPDIRTVEPGGSVVGIAPGGKVTEYVRANPGNAAPYSPVSGNIPQGAIDMLKGNPSLKGAFDQKYGAGAADSVLLPNRPAGWTPGIAPGGVGGNVGSGF